MQKEEEHEQDGEAGDDDDLDRDVEQGQPSGGGALAVPLDLGDVQQRQATGRGCSVGAFFFSRHTAKSYFFST